jgi:AraC family transcriptional regulator
MTATTQSPAATCAHEATAAARAQAVNSAIVAMRDRLGEHQELKDAACAAFMSPFHFHRVFRSITKATPGQFRTAMRMAEAKRLLLESQMSATDISVAVGYGSFGTFTSQFTKLVGLSPGRFRRTARAVADVPVRALLGRPEANWSGAKSPNGTSNGNGNGKTGRPHQLLRTAGWLSARPDGTAGVAIVALFPATLAQDRPVACAMGEPPCRVTLAVDGIGGSFVALAASVRAEATVRDVLTLSPAAGMYVGSPPEPVELDGTPPDEFFIALREPLPTDPPVLTAFPLLALS